MTSSEPRRYHPGLLALAPLLALLALAGLGCGSGDTTDRSLTALAAEGRYTVAAPGEGTGASPLRFAVEPRVETVSLDDEHRPAIVLPADGDHADWTWRVRVPEDGWLQVGVGLLPPEGAAGQPGVGAGVGPGAGSGSGAGAGMVEGTVTMDRGSEREVLAVIRQQPTPANGAARPAGGSPAPAGWVDVGADLSQWAGREVTLELAAHVTPERSSAANQPGWRIAWGPVAVSTDRPDPALRKEGRPNVLFILVDTMRRDHLTPYGYERDTTPEIERRLAQPGAVVEDAYSQAPWTLPSVVSFMTSRYPGEILSGDPATFGIPDGVPALAEVLSGLGYRTGGFFANPTLRATNGFVRGFDTFYTPSSMSAIEDHADSLNRRVLPWLQAHRDAPFFLYVHYIDPHDPYMNPDVVDGRSTIFDDPGGINGRWVHGVYAGKVPIQDMDRTVRHLTALYDTEIHYVDRSIGKLLAAIPPRVLANTLVVLTADHGEELHDHGGWKHGLTLYQDQIHVPLLFRWDDRIPAGKRLHGTVRLVDVAPTLVAAAGGEAPAAWEGTDLLPALTGDAPLPRLPAFAQHLTTGPMRVAAVLDGKKLMLFNRREPFVPGDDLQAYLYHLNMGRMKRLELYDVDADPHERHNLLDPAGPADGAAPPGDSVSEQEVDRLDGVIRYHLHSVLRGLRAMTDALPEGHRLSGTLRFAEAPLAAVPLFLGPEDSLTVDGTRVTFDIVGEAVAKGFLLPGTPGALVEAALRLDGEPLPAARLRLGTGTPFTGGTVEPAALDTETYPAPAERPGLRLWRFSGVRPESDQVDPETERSLRALGYIK